MSGRKIFVYGTILALLGGCAYFLFREPPYLAELKEKAPAVTGVDEATAVVKEALAAVLNNEQKKFTDLLMRQDSNEFPGYIEQLWKEPKFIDTEIIGSEMLIRSSRKDNIQVIVWSRNRKSALSFAMLRNEKGIYRIYTITPSGRKPEK